jgi:hypothetical protein
VKLDEKESGYRAPAEPIETVDEVLERIRLFEALVDEKTRKRDHRIETNVVRFLCVLFLFILAALGTLFITRGVEDDIVVDKIHAKSSRGVDFYYLETRGRYTGANPQSEVTRYEYDRAKIGKPL